MVGREQWVGGKVLICRRWSWEVGRRGLDADTRAGEGGEEEEGREEGKMREE